MGRVRAVDHEIGRTVTGCRIHRGHCRAKFITDGQLSVRFDHKRDRNRNTRLLCRPANADGFRHIVHHQGGDQIGRGIGQNADLLSVIGFGLGLSHQCARVV